MPYWTIEEVAENLNLTVAQVRESRRRKEWPGVLGRMRGRRLQFDADLVQAGPQVAENTTTDVSKAILWTLQGIEAKVAEIAKAIAKHDDVTVAEAARFMQSYYFGDTTTQGDEEE